MKNVARKTEQPLPHVSYVRRDRSWARSRPEFPGCRPVRIPSAEISSYEGRYEVWEAQTETAWMVREPTTPYHERPSRDLVQSVRLIAALRGVRKTVEFMAVLASRGFVQTPALMEGFGLIARIDEAELLRLAMNCRDEADLLERMGAAASRGD